MTQTPKCELCGEPMPVGEEMFKFHGYSGPCPKPPAPKELPTLAVGDWVQIESLTQPLYVALVTDEGRRFEDSWGSSRGVQQIREVRTATGRVWRKEPPHHGR